MNLRQFIDRYGVPLGAVLALAVVLALLPGNSTNGTRVSTGGGGVFDQGQAAGSGVDNSTPVDGGSTATGPAADTGGSAGGGAVAGATGGAARGGATGVVSGGGGAAKAQAPVSASGGSAVVFGKGPHCRGDGRQAGISYYMPPCVQWAGGNNGGSTWKGVTAKKVVIVRYLPQLDPGTQAILQSYGLADDGATIKRAYSAILDYSNHHYETYGREVVFQDFSASGPSESDEAMIADAVKIAEDIKPFAVIEGNPAAPMPTILIRELSQRGVLCLCSTTLSAQFYRENPLVIATGLPIADEYAEHAAEYVGKRLAHKKAVYAGDELNALQGFKNKERKFGLIYLNGARGKVDPEGGRIKAKIEQAFAKYGVSFAKEIGYLYDPGRNQNDVTNMVAQMKDAGVTTIVPAWDPLYPILITQEATNQQYFPEWLIVGTGLSDTTTAARLYNQLQWRHAFGISPLWITWSDVRHSPGWREYYHARPNDPDGSEGVLINIYRARIQTLLRGIHMAGPTLNLTTFRQGEFRFPKTPADGGHPALPLVYMTPAAPSEIKDFVEVYYDITISGPDERSRNGQGMIVKTDNGKRYQLGQWPKDDPHVYKGGATTSNTPPGGTDPPHEQDAHHHPQGGCLDCT